VSDEPLVPGPSDLEYQMVNQNLKIYKSPGSDKIPAELVAARGRTVVLEMPN